MKKRSYYILLLLVLIYTIIYRVFICNYLLKFNECLTSVFSLLLLFLSYKLLGYRKTINNETNKRITKTVIIRLIAFFIIYYAVGYVTGFLKNSYSMNIFDIINNSVFILISYLSIELFRYIFISSNKENNKGIVLLTLVLILFDSNLLIRFDTFKNIESIFSYLIVYLLPCILNNILLSYLTYTTNNYKSSLIYRLLLELYIFIVPVVPDTNDLTTSILFLILPFSLLISSSKEVTIKEEKTKKSKKGDIIFIIILLFLISIVFGIGPFKMVGIETASMTPNFNVGDAVIINKFINKDELKENDVIAYYDKDNRLIVHRIIKINGDKTFITKGDMNNTADSKYVSKDQIYGKVIFRIPYIAYPAVKLREK